MVSIGQMFLMLKCGENVFPCAQKWTIIVLKYLAIDMYSDGNLLSTFPQTMKAIVVCEAYFKQPLFTCRVKPPRWVLYKNKGPLGESSGSPKFL